MPSCPKYLAVPLKLLSLEIPERDPTTLVLKFRAEETNGQVITIRLPSGDPSVAYWGRHIGQGFEARIQPLSVPFEAREAEETPRREASVYERIREESEDPPDSDR